MFTSCWFSVLFTSLHGWWLSHDSVIRAALIAALATFVTGALATLGVVATLISNRRAQREERLLTLRRDAYLRAAEAYAAAAHMLGFIADLSFNMAFTFPVVKDFAAAVAKIHLVGNQRLIEASLRLHVAYTAIYTALVTDRHELDQLNIQIGANNSRITQLYGYRLESEAARDAMRKEISELESRNTSLFAAIVRKQWDMMKYVLENGKELGPLAAEATLAAKEEFGVGVDDEWYTKLLADSAATAIEHAKQCLKRIESTVTSKSSTAKTPADG